MIHAVGETIVKERELYTMYTDTSKVGEKSKGVCRANLSKIIITIINNIQARHK